MMGDRDVPRVLFLAQHEPDELLDTLWFLGSSEGGSVDAPDGMVVFGFGRGPDTTPLLGSAGHRFTVGLLEQHADTAAQHASIQRAIEQVLTETTRFDD